MKAVENSLNHNHFPLRDVKGIQHQYMMIVLCQCYNVPLHGNFETTTSEMWIYLISTYNDNVPNNDFISCFPAIREFGKN